MAFELSYPTIHFVFCSSTVVIPELFSSAQSVLTIAVLFLFHPALSFFNLSSYDCIYSCLFPASLQTARYSLLYYIVCAVMLWEYLLRPYMWGFLLGHWYIFTDITSQYLYILVLGCHSIIFLPQILGWYSFFSPKCSASCSLVSKVLIFLKVFIKIFWRM